MSRRKGIIDALRLRRITSSKEWRELRGMPIFEGVIKCGAC